MQSILGVDHSKLEELYGCPVTIADRDAVESDAESIYEASVEQDVAFLVVGDPLCATTHTDIMLRAREIGARVEVVHNASVMGACASSGLQLYSFGQTVSIPYFDPKWRPDSFYPKIAYNRGGDMHTLCLLDIKVKEPDFDAMMRGQTRFHPPRFMTVNTAVEQLLEIEEKRKEGAYGPETMGVGLARLGQPSQQIVAGTLAELLHADLGGPLHSLIICGELHELELEFLQPYRVNAGSPSPNTPPPPPAAGTDAGGTTPTTQGATAAAAEATEAGKAGAGAVP